MAQPVEFRLPGVFFLPHPPAANLRLPRLDVAAFVGFAERGPLDLPVPLEDFRAYQQVFGGDLPLAQESALAIIAAPASPPEQAGLGSTSQGVVNAHLPRAVQAFFANGGRRCYVVRVAGERAEAARFRLPGVLALGGPGGPKLAGVSASSPGAWGGRLSLASRLAVTPLPPNLFGWQESGQPGLALRADPRLLRLGGAAPLRAGDVLRLSLEGGSRLLAVVGSVEAGPVLRLASAHPLERLLAPQPASRLERLTVEGSAPLADSAALDAPGEGSPGQMVLRLAPDAGQQLSAGDILRLALEDGETLCLARVEELRASRQTPGSPVEAGVEAALSDLLFLREVERPPLVEDSPAHPAGILAVELLRLDLLVRLGQRRFPAIPDLAYNAGTPPPRVEPLGALPNGSAARAAARHPRFWGDAAWLASAFSTSAAAASRSASDPAASGEAAYAASAGLFRQLFADPYHVRPTPGEPAAGESILPEDPRFWDPAQRGFSPLAALSGLLAPAGSGLSLSFASAAESPLDAGGEAELAQVYLPLGLPEIFSEADPAQFLPPEDSRQGKNDLDRFEPQVFYDRRLAPPGSPGLDGIGESFLSLPGTAAGLRYFEGARLRGMHSLMFVEEAALVSIPDAAHQPWEPAAPLPEPPPPRPALPPGEPDCPPPGDFLACDLPPSLQEVEPHWGPLDVETPVVVRGRGFTTSQDTRLFFGGRPAEEVQVHSSTELTAAAPTGLRLGPVEVRVTTDNGSGSFPDGFTYTAPVKAEASALPRVIPPGPNDLPADAPILQVHRALSVLCQARGDLVGVLSLPQAYDLAGCLDWQAELRSLLRLPSLEQGEGFDEPAEAADLSYLAVYHPWLRVFDPAAPARSRLTPPDGAVCGLIAARERQRSAWIAPANRPLAGVLGLAGSFSEEDWARLFARGFNLVRPEANGFAPLSAHTLSAERSLLQISVRRLLILLKKAAVDLGMDFAFESNHAIFREGVRVVLEEFLGDLYDQGAFAGGSRAGAFRVVTDDSVNPPESVEAGRFIVLIQVAPSQPMEFITVQLTRLSEGGLVAGEA